MKFAIRKNMKKAEKIMKYMGHFVYRAFDSARKR